MDNLSLRIADFADEAFLQDLFFDVRHAEFAIAGLPSEQLKLLLAMQYAAQKQSYKWTFPTAKEAIIVFDGKKIGRLLITRDGQKIHLIDIAILSETRGKGIGSFVLNKLKSEASAISLRVFKTNFGAKKFYERHGFTIARDDGKYIEMEWKNA